MPARYSWARWLAFFAITRAAAIWWFAPRVYWDVYYYWFTIAKGLGLAETLVEYPTPVVWFASAMYALAPGREAFQLVFALTFVAIDGLVAVALWRKHRAAGGYWVTFGAAVGAISYYRLDLLPAALVALACLWLYARPRTSGALLGLGAAIKLWPALLAFPLVGACVRGNPGRRRLASFLAVGGGLGLASLIAAGWARSSSPLTWQHDRGLQIESVAATPLMLARALGGEPSAWSVQFPQYNAWEVVGPGASMLLAATSVATLGVFVLACWLSARAYRRHRSGLGVAEGVLATVLTVICWLIVANKTFSTQYVWWLAGPLALLFAIGKHTYRRIGFVAIGVALATQYVYPWAYDAVVAGEVTPTLVLAARNIGMLGLAITSSVAAWRATTPHFRVASSHQA